MLIILKCLGYQYVPQNVLRPVSNRQFDNPSYILPAPGSTGPSLADANLLEQRVNGIKNFFIV